MSHRSSFNNPITQLNEAPMRPTPELPTVSPRVDIHESATELLFIADLPGATAESLQLRLERELLTIEATPDLSALPELAPFRYRRAFALRRAVDADGIKASLKDGVLRVTVPRRDTARRIEVVEA